VSTLTTAFLGVAHIHTPGFIKSLNARTAEVRVKSVFDVQAERGKQRAGEMPGADFVSSAEAIFADPEITSVVICSETVQHKDLVVAAAKAGKHIFCEKPLGLGAADSKVMADAIKAAGVTFQTGFFMRGDSKHQFIKREVAAGNLGKITRIRYSNCHQAALDGWFDTDWRWLADAKQAGGGAMLDLGAHPMDLIIDTYLPTEGEVVDVAANSLTVELAGTEDKLEAFIDLVRPYGIESLARTGVIAMPRGTQLAKDKHGEQGSQKRVRSLEGAAGVALPPS